jgi:hypothetical protein
VERALVRHLQSDELSGVERRAAADGDDDVRVVRSERRDAVDDVLLDRVRVDAVEDHRRDSAGLERLAHLLGDAGLHDACVGDDERTLLGEVLHVLGERGQRALSEHDLGGKAPGDERHGPAG